MKAIQCPTCKKEVPWSEKSLFRPFCSERCRLIDLGAWADGSYAVPVQTPLENQDSLTQQPDLEIE
jgi:endogenous inhibitor of DNA gyrase (YacG/DUF329 family)